MKISKEARRTSRQLFRACLVDGQLDEGRVRMVVSKLSQAKPRGYLGILDAFCRQVSAEIEGQRAQVESAAPLSEELQTQLKSGLESKCGRPLDLHFSVTPELLGGVRVKVGSDVWDGSVKARLEALKDQLV
jgi:F-type H+-transporting ATPase subunit delta